MKRSITILALVIASLSAKAEDAASAVSSSPTIGEYFGQGGPLMWVLLAFSIFAVAYVVYLLCILRQGVVIPRAVMNDVMDRLMKGESDEARRLCDYHRSPFSSVAKVAIDSAANLPEAEPSVLTSVVEGEGARQAEVIQGRAQWLLDVATVSPMVGLLGTVTGMLKAFEGVGGDTIASAKPVVLAQGVSMALITTIAGLLIAVPCMIAYAIFRRMAAKRVASLECAAADVVTVIISRRTSGK